MTDLITLITVVLPRSRLSRRTEHDGLVHHYFDRPHLQTPSNTSLFARHVAIDMRFLLFAEIRWCGRVPGLLQSELESGLLPSLWALHELLCPGVGKLVGRTIV